MQTFQKLLQANEAGELLSAKGLVCNITIKGTLLKEQVDCFPGKIKLVKSASLRHCQKTGLSRH